MWPNPPGPSFVCGRSSIREGPLADAATEILPRRIGILADDWTGAGDAGLAFWREGWETVLWAPVSRRRPVPPRRAGVWVIDTESRLCGGKEARRRVRRALKALRKWGAEFIFKKVDSTLRGPVGPELEAFLDEGRALARRNHRNNLPPGPLPFVAAFPRLGRITRGGRHYVDGVLLHRSPFSRDPRNPQTLSRVEDLLGLADGFRSKVWIPDVASPSDLRNVAREVHLLGLSSAVGSAGFAAALARSWRRKRRKPTPGFGPTWWAVVAGSAHPRTKAQIAFLKRRLNGNKTACPGVLLSTPAERGDPGAVGRTLLRRAAGLHPRGRRPRWIATGGETAFALVRRWALPSWRIVGELAVGVPLCRVSGRDGRELVLKPGGFGPRNILWKSIRRQSP